MNFFQKLKNKLYYNALNKSLNKIRTLRLSTSLEDADTIGLLFNASDEKQTTVVLKYAKTLSNEGKKVSILGYFDTKKELEDIDFPFFTKKEIDFIGKPKGEIVEQFMLNPFDLLINLTGETNPPFDYIMALSKASFRVGPSTKNTSSCDLMIDTKNPNDLANFIKQAEFFLNKMTTQHEPIPA